MTQSFGEESRAFLQVYLDGEAWDALIIPLAPEAETNMKTTEVNDQYSNDNTRSTISNSNFLLTITCLNHIVYSSIFRPLPSGSPLLLYF